MKKAATRHDEKTLRLAVGRERKLWLAERARARRHGARAALGLAQHVHVHQVARRAGAGQPTTALPLRHRAAGHRRVRASASRSPAGTRASPPRAAGLRRHQGPARHPRRRATPSSISSRWTWWPGPPSASPRTRCGPRTARLPPGQRGHEPFYASRSVELVGLYRAHALPRTRETGNALAQRAALAHRARAGQQARVRDLRARRCSSSGARLLRQVIDDVKPTWGAPKVQRCSRRPRSALDDVEEQASRCTRLIELFLPFICENRYVFRCDNTRAVYARHAAARPGSSSRGPPRPSTGAHYFFEVHLPGLEKWVFPGLEEETQRRPSSPPPRPARDARGQRPRVAPPRGLPRAASEKEEPLHLRRGPPLRRAAWAASSCARASSAAIACCSPENHPAWPIAYFGILRAGASAIPVGPRASEARSSPTSSAPPARGSRSGTRRRGQGRRLGARDLPASARLRPRRLHLAAAMTEDAAIRPPSCRARERR